MDCRLLCPEASVANTGAAGASVRSGIIFPADAATRHGTGLRVLLMRTFKQRR